MNRRKRQQSPVLSVKRPTSTALMRIHTGLPEPFSGDTGLVPMRSPSPPYLNTSTASETGETSTNNSSNSQSSSSKTTQPQLHPARITIASNLHRRIGPAVHCRGSMATEGLPSLKSLRERSDDSNFQLQVPQCLSRFPATDALPIFPGGDVIVRSDLVDPPKQWQFHSTGLVRQSTWFARDIHEQQLTSTKTTDWYLYGIEEVDGQVKLSRRPAEGPRPITVQSQNDDLLEKTTVKREDDDSDALYKTILHVYDQIFKAFYGLPSLITPSNIQLATSEAEQLVKVATDLGCIHLVSSQIGNALLQYRQTLYKAILADPPRYLLLSLVLENDFIYTESLIHLVGAHPCYPWPTPHTTLPEHTKRLIARKSLDLDIEVLRVERELLLLTITTHRGTSYSPDQHSQFDTWFIVQYFRNMLTEVLREHDAAKPALKRGNFFRKIRSGRYMEYEQVRQQVQKIMPSAVDTLGEDLRILKECASEIVEEMARNEASLDVEESKVGWLTCVKVEEKDIPWRAVAVSEA